MTAACPEYPVLQAGVQDVYYTEGIGSVLFSRELPDGSVAVAVFLVDRYCLGVKNALGDILTRSAYDSKFERQMRAQYPASNVSPAAWCTQAGRVGWRSPLLPATSASRRIPDYH